MALAARAQVLGRGEPDPGRARRVGERLVAEHDYLPVAGGPRSITLTPRQTGSASRAARTAASRSSALDSATRASVSPVAGFVTGSASWDDEGVQRPPT